MVPPPPVTAALSRPSPAPPCLHSDFDRIDEEMRAYDEKREVEIKRSRDIQKLSKQAIFSMHRGAHEEAAQRLAAAKAGALELVPIIQANPMLRPGSYSAAVEEYAEVRCTAGGWWGGRAGECVRWEVEGSAMCPLPASIAATPNTFLLPLCYCPLQALAFRTYLAEGRLITQSEVELAEIEECEWHCPCLGRLAGLLGTLAWPAHAWSGSAVLPWPADALLSLDGRLRLVVNTAPAAAAAGGAQPSSL